MRPSRDSNPPRPSYPINDNPSPNALGAGQYATPGSISARNNPQLTNQPINQLSNEIPIWVSELANGESSADRAGQPGTAGPSEILEDGSPVEARGGYFQIGENELDAVFYRTDPLLYPKFENMVIFRSGNYNTTLYPRKPGLSEKYSF